MPSGQFYTHWQLTVSCHSLEATVPTHSFDLTPFTTWLSDSRGLKTGTIYNYTSAVTRVLEALPDDETLWDLPMVEAAIATSGDAHANGAAWRAFRDWAKAMGVTIPSPEPGRRGPTKGFRIPDPVAEVLVWFRARYPDSSAWSWSALRRTTWAHVHVDFGGNRFSITTPPPPGSSSVEATAWFEAEGSLLNLEVLWAWATDGQPWSKARIEAWTGTFVPNKAGGNSAIPVRLGPVIEAKGTARLNTWLNYLSSHDEYDIYPTYAAAETRGIVIHF